MNKPSNDPEPGGPAPPRSDGPTARRARDPVRGADNAVITTNVDGGVVHLNRAARSLTGWSQSEASGRPVEDVFRIVDRDTNLSRECPTTRALREGEVVGLPRGVAIVNRDGTSRPIADVDTTARAAIPISDAEGRVAGVLLVFSEAGPGREGVEARSALDYAGEVIANLPIPYAILGEGREVAAANGPFLEVFRVSKAQAEGRPFDAIGDGRWDSARLEAWFEGVTYGELDGEEYAVDFRSEAAGRKALSLNGRRIAPGGGRPDLILVAVADPDRQESRDFRLLRSEQRYRRLFEAAKDGILILDAVEARVVDANPFLIGLLGYSLGELMGKELWEIGLFSEKEASERAVNTLLEEGYIRFDHLPLVTKAGTEVEVEFVSNVYPEGDTNVIQCNIRDITERRELERLAAQQAEASELANRRKDEFLAMLSHELRNPLASILNAVQIFRLRPDHDPAQRHAREILERQVGFLTHLVDDLLEVSRITSGSFSLVVERCDVRKVIESSVDSVHPMIVRLGHQLTASIPPDPIWIEADPARLEQVVVNLLTNAAKYTDAPGRIALGLRREGDEVVIRVTDSGIGISGELLPRVFELFKQADRSLERSQGGLGIGLTLVERIVDLHHGRVEAYSAGLGQGSEFVVRLPAGTSPTGPDETGSANRALPPTRVLVVDDNVDFADGIALLLRASGYEVRVVHDGPGAIRSAIESRPDVVVLDIGLPGMDGYEVARQIRLEPALEGLRLIAVSGYRPDREKLAIEKARFDDYLLKPVLIEDLMAHLLPD